MGRGTVGSATGGLVEVLNRTPIGQKTTVILLRVQGQVIVAAQSAQGVQPLMTLSDPSQVAALIAEVEASRPKSITQGFKQILQGFDDEHDAKDKEALDEGQDNQEHQVDRARDELSGLMQRIRTLGGGRKEVEK